VNIEALLIAAGENVKRLGAAWNRDPRKLAQVAALHPPDTRGSCRSNLSGCGGLLSSEQRRIRRISTAWQAKDKKRELGALAPPAASNR